MAKLLRLTIDDGNAGVVRESQELHGVALHSGPYMMHHLPRLPRLQIGHHTVLALKENVCRASMDVGEPSELMA